ncbi:unnamed protein product [Mytilus coruscus]|uniref:Uncharacterized protein n=1 Tax=Mytilus coruscus TaxID=42192 RepID=A0A6J8D635_MYTCO|nr:unnamed protein product [Mytilus coruscus]
MHEIDTNDIFKAAQQGNINLFQNLGKKELTSWLHKTYPKSGDTVLHYACRFGQLELVKVLLDNGADLESANFDGKRALHEAAQYDSLGCVQYLLSYGAQVDSLKRADWTPLMLACTKSNVRIIQALLDRGADQTLKNKDGWNCFHIATREGHEDIVHFLHSKNSEVWNNCSKNGRSPLHTTALHGCTSVVCFLLKNCAYPVDQKDSCGSTPLMDALRSGHTNIAKLLLDVQKEGQTDTVRFLLSAGADVDHTDTMGRTALHIASGGQHADTVRLLLEHGAQMLNDKTGTTPDKLARKDIVKDVFIVHGKIT